MVAGLYGVHGLRALPRVNVVNSRGNVVVPVPHHLQMERLALDQTFKLVSAC
jgi:hypothetical protein